MKTGSLVAKKTVSSGSGLASKKNDIYLSMTSKAITPLPYDLPPPDERRKRVIDETSAWTPGDIYVRDFSTQQDDDFMDPRKHLHIMDHMEEAEAAQRVKWEQEKAGEQKAALEKLAGLAQLKYGNMGNMLRAFKKNTSDTITLPEFGEHLRRRNMDSLLPLEDQELIWEQLKATARGSVGVGQLSKAVDETIDTTNVYDADVRDIKAMRNFLKEEVTKKREADSQFPSQEPHGLADKDEEMKRAIGQKTFDLDIGAEEMDSVLEGLFSKKHTKDAHEKYARFLRLTNVNLHAIPFYDLRSDELSRLKRNAQRLGNELQGPEVTTQLQTLKAITKNRILDDLEQSRITRAEAEAKEEAKYSPFLSGAMSPIKRAGSRSLGGSASSGAMPTSYSNPTSSRGVDSGSRLAQVHTLDTHYGEHPLVYDPNASTHSAHSHSSSSLLEPESAAGALFGDMDPSMYNSTYSEYYPPLNYQPNKPITRDCVSDADAKFVQRNYRRQLRQKRTEANTKLTSDRLNLERLGALRKQLKGEHSRTEDMIRYQTTVFLHDLKCYKKQPLQTMSLKPNLTKSDAMWGGSQKFDSANGQESRDFKTTFTNSFLSNAPKAEPNIDIEAKVRLMYAKAPH